MNPIRRAPLLALLAALPLAACDDGGDTTKVTLIMRDIGYDRSYFVAAPTVAEVHNSPFGDVTPQEVAALLTLPQSYPKGLTFAYSSPDADPKPRIRLVLAFNARSPNSGEALCRGDDGHGSRVLGGPEPYDKLSFMADMALCRDTEPLASASLQARTGQVRDVEFLRRSLRRLMYATFGSLSERGDP